MAPGNLRRWGQSKGKGGSPAKGTRRARGGSTKGSLPEDMRIEPEYKTEESGWSWSQRREERGSVRESRGCQLRRGGFHSLSSFSCQKGWTTPCRGSAVIAPPHPSRSREDGRGQETILGGQSWRSRQRRANVAEDASAIVRMCATMLGAKEEKRDPPG